MDGSKQNLLDVKMILVPQGAEYQAVCKGLQHLNCPLPQVVSIPIGSSAVSSVLTIWLQVCRDSKQPLSSVVVMGLCGSLKPTYAVGTTVLYRQCIRAASTDTVHTGESINNRLQTDPALTQRLASRLPNVTKPLVAVTCDRIVHTVQAKLDLAETYDADVVDMEGFAVLQALQQQGVAVAMLRVVSDDCNHDLPDLNAAIDKTGTLQPIPMAIGMIRQPIASMHLIRGSLKALRTLQTTVSMLFAP